MTEDFRTLINAIGAFFLGAMYLGGLIAAGIAWDAGLVVYLAITSAGVGYLCQVIATFPETPLSAGMAIGLWLTSVFAGTLAGMFLLGAAL